MSALADFPSARRAQVQPAAVALTVACAQPAVDADDLAATVEAHAALVSEATADLVVFPELSLTGYELAATAVSLEDRRLAPLIDACATTGTTALVGGPVAEQGKEHIATIVIDRTGARTAYRKVHLGGLESRRFSPGTEATVISVDGWRVGLGICKDTGVDEHVRAMAGQRLDLYAAGVVHLPAELAEQERRARRIATACDAPVALASFAGPTGDGYDATAGCSGIWSATGTPIAVTGSEAGTFARAVLTRKG